MVFEEFFLKKKIDLVQLQNVEPNLFNEFKNHYSLMGEKSFDHTKKYWFNKLRHTYPLSAEEEIRLKELFKGEKPLAKAEAMATETKTESAVSKPAGFTPKFKATSTIQKTVEPVADNLAENNEESKPVGFKPRFKPGLTKTVDTANASATEETKPATDASIEKPKGFTPRFKAGATKVVADTTEKANSESDNKTPAAKQVGFKPKFKTGVTPQSTESKEEEKVTEEIASVTKPSGFTPRFKAGTTKVVAAAPKEETPDTAEQETLASEALDNAPKADKEVIAEQTEAPKPLGFKPRFKAGETKVVSTTETITETPTNQKIIQTEETPLQELKKEKNSSQIARKPLGFKPRFQAKNKKDE